MKVGKTLKLALRKIFLVSFLFAGLFFCINSQTGFAQNDGLDTLYVTGEPEFLENEIIPDRDNNKDDNGRLAAGLLVQSDISGLSFNSNNGIIKSQKRPGETLLFLSPDERRVRILKEGFEPLSLILSEHDIDLVQGNVWLVKVTGSKEENKIPINIIPEPRDAQIRVDGSVVESMPVQLASGEYELQIQRENYNSIDTTITVSEKKTLFEPVLKEVEIQEVTISSNPPGARISIDNSTINEETPHSFYEFPGQYTLTLSKEGYVNISEQITVGVGENEFNYDLIPNRSSLQVNSIPSSARILLNNEEIPDGEHIEKSPGKYKLEVSADGYHPYSEVIELQRDSALIRDVSLEQKMGDLQFTVSPRFATVKLQKDGRDVENWEGLNILRDLPAGTYRIVANASGHSSKVRTIEIEDGVTNNIDMELTPVDGQSTVTVDGMSGEAKVTFKGVGPRSSKNHSFDELPIKNESISYGQYELVVKKEGFKTISKQVHIDEDDKQFSVTGDFEPKSKFGSFMWSVFFPGGGQFYMRRSGRGVLYLLGNAAAIGFTVKSGLDFMEGRDQYQDALNEYQSATSDFEQKRSLVDETYSAQQNARKNMMIGLGVFGGVKFIELLDNLIYSTPNQNLQQSNIEFDNKGNSLVLRFNF